jgi:hypothetical protein
MELKLNNLLNYNPWLIVIISHDVIFGESKNFNKETMVSTLDSGSK